MGHFKIATHKWNTTQERIIFHTAFLLMKHERTCLSESNIIWYVVDNKILFVILKETDWLMYVSLFVETSVVTEFGLLLLSATRYGNKAWHRRRVPKIMFSPVLREWWGCRIVDRQTNKRKTRRQQGKIEECQDFLYNGRCTTKGKIDKYEKERRSERTNDKILFILSVSL